MPTNGNLNKDEHDKSVDVKKYRGMIGSLLYLTASRPDIMFSVCMCARYQSNPKESHLKLSSVYLDIFMVHLSMGYGIPREPIVA